MRTRKFGLGLLVVLGCSVGSAQIFPKPTTKPLAVPEPMQLLQKLMPVEPNGAPCDSKACEEGRASALAALGIPARLETNVEARLTLEDLDGDGSPEALLAVQIDLAYVDLFILKRKGNQWFRLPSPPEMSCWCKYEDSPLDTFAEIRGWGDPYDKPRQPQKLIFVHPSGGGTGLYDRHVYVFALWGLELRLAFDSTEERREYPPGDKGALDHTIVTIEEYGDAQISLVARKFHTAMDPEKAISDETWWAGLPPSDCEAYIWSLKQLKLVRSAAATSERCHRNTN